MGRADPLRSTDFTFCRRRLNLSLFQGLHCYTDSPCRHSAVIKDALGGIVPTFRNPKSSIVPTNPHPMSVFRFPWDDFPKLWLHACEHSVKNHQHTNLIPAAHYNGKHVYHIGAYLPQDSKRFLMSDSELIGDWHQYLKTIHPSFDPALIEGSHLFRFKDAQHIVDRGYESKIIPYESPLPGVFLANFTQIFPEDRGTNFAVKEGIKVGKRICDFLKHGTTGQVAPTDSYQ